MENILWECFFWSVCKDVVYCIADEREVMNMVGLEWNEKLFREAVFEDGLEQGLEQGRISAVLNMLKEKLPLEMIARISEMSVEKIREIGKTHSLL